MKLPKPLVFSIRRPKVCSHDWSWSPWHLLFMIFPESLGQILLRIPLCSRERSKMIANCLRTWDLVNYCFLNDLDKSKNLLFSLNSFIKSEYEIIRKINLQWKCSRWKFIFKRDWAMYLFHVSIFVLRN